MKHMSDDLVLFGTLQDLGMAVLGHPGASTGVVSFYEKFSWMSSIILLVLALSHTYYPTATH